MRNQFFNKRRTIVLELGNGDSLTDRYKRFKRKNSKAVAVQIIDEIAKMDNKKYDIVFKLQLFTKESVDYLTPIEHGVYDFIHKYCEVKGYQCTASVFDYESLNFLQGYDTPFIKIAARENLYPMIAYIEKPLVSVQSGAQANQIIKENRGKKIKFLYCIPEYPANYIKYESMFGDSLNLGISDHTSSLYLFKEYQPLIYEKHIILMHGQTDDPFGDSFCSTPDDWKRLI